MLRLFINLAAVMLAHRVLVFKSILFTGSLTTEQLDRIGIVENGDKKQKFSVRSQVGEKINYKYCVTNSL